MPARCSADERRTGSLVATRCGASRLQNGSRRGKDAGRTMVGDFPFGLEPMLDVAGFERHRGGGHPPTPATPPCVRVRTRRFETVTLVPIRQMRETERVEIGR